jgi:hypothetical protein
MGAHDRRIDHLDEVSGAAHSRQKGEHRLENAPLASRQNRFQTLFQCQTPGNARQVML